MLILQSDLLLNGFRFDFVADITIQSSWDLLTDRAEIVIPQNISYRRDGQLIRNIVEGDNAIFQRGGSVEVSLGYGQVKKRFQGFISDVFPQRPIRLDCEDEMYLLKQTNINKFSKSKVTLPDLLQEILPKGTQFEAIELNLGDFRIKNSNVAKVLQWLKKNYGVSSYFRDGVLFSGLAYQTEDPTLLTPIIFEFEKNIIDDSDLIYKKVDDQKIKLRAVSIFPDNTKVEIEVGDPDGDQRTIYRYNVSESDLREIAEEEIKKIRYEGFKGSFEAFLEPMVKHGDAVQIINQDIPEKNGVYLVKKVTTSFGQEGGRQFIELDRRIS